MADYTRATQERLQSIRDRADASRENWLFGAHNNAQVRKCCQSAHTASLLPNFTLSPRSLPVYYQVLFMYGLEEDKFKGILDNSALKHNRRMYGTGLTCHAPRDVIGRPRGPGELPLRIFISIGSYN